jgi:hypothetical protein
LDRVIVRKNSYFVEGRIAGFSIGKMAYDLCLQKFTLILHLAVRDQVSKMLVGRTAIRHRINTLPETIKG